MGDHITRRAAVLALSCIGDYSSNAVFGRALVDRDRGVRTIAESGIRELWCRIGNRQQRKCCKIVRLNDSKRYEEAARLATELIHNSPWIAEAWCQRGTAHYHLGQYDAAIRDCHQALEINPYHFTAAAGMGQCYMLARQPRRRVGSLPPGPAAEPRPGRSPGPSGAAAALAQRGLKRRTLDWAWRGAGSKWAPPAHRRSEVRRSEVHCLAPRRKPRDSHEDAQESVGVLSILAQARFLTFFAMPRPPHYHSAHVRRDAASGRDWRGQSAQALTSVRSHLSHAEG